GRSQGVGIPCRGEEPCLAMLDQLGRASDLRRHYRQAEGHRLEYGAGKPLVERGQDEEIQLMKDRRHVVPPSGEDDVPVQLLGAYVCPQSLSVSVALWTIGATYNQELDARAAAEDLGKGMKEVELALPGSEGADSTDYLPPRLERERLGETSARRK